ncbi:MAG: ornithine cyclodeaminase family protein [Thermoprotei archaeon]|jgi:ornithine cyclodeaminase/alanine dehydrogenase-like protein (mu-crystallin family)
MVLIIPRNIVEELLKPTDVVRIVEKVFVDRGLGKVTLPSRVWIDSRVGSFGLMPSYMKSENALGFKGVFFNPIKKPTIRAFIGLIDPEDGSLIALMDGDYITAMRTGGIGAVAADKLSRQDSHVVAVYGCGVQGRAQVTVLQVVRKIEIIYAYDSHKPSLENYVREMSEKLGIEVKPMDNPNEYVSNADIIITTTTSHEPVFDGRLIKDGTHINGIGSFSPETREIDENAVLRANKIFVDFKDDAIKSGDLKVPLDKGLIKLSSIYELSDLLVGKIQGRQSFTEVTFFKSVGAAIFDVATAVWVYNEAKKKGLGIETTL